MSVVSVPRLYRANRDVKDPGWRQQQSRAESAAEGTSIMQGRAHKSTGKSGRGTAGMSAGERRCYTTNSTTHSRRRRRAEEKAGPQWGGEHVDLNAREEIDRRRCEAKSLILTKLQKMTWVATSSDTWNFGGFQSDSAVVLYGTTGIGRRCMVVFKIQ